MNPENQERWNKQQNAWMGQFRQIGRYKPPSGTACRRFEPKENDNERYGL
jgi:hypothetical protein